MESPRKFGPKTEGNPTIGKPCPACNIEFKIGDYTALVLLGPGNDPDEQEKARNGRPYNAVGLEVHFSCATGHECEAGVGVKVDF